MNEKLLKVGATSHSTTDAQVWGRSDLTENTMVQLLPPQLSASTYANLTLAYSPQPTLLSPSRNRPQRCWSTHPLPGGIHEAWFLGCWAHWHSPALIKNTGPSKTKQRQTSPPRVIFPLCATVYRSLVLHQTAFKIAFVQDGHTGHFCMRVRQQQCSDCNRNNVHFFPLLTE